MTSVLTDKEKAALRDGTRDIVELIDDVQAAVIKRLAAGVIVEPAGWKKGCKLFYQNVGWKDPSGFEPLYTATALAAARVQMNERCVQACAAKSKEYLARSNRDQHSHGAGLGAAICAELISALLGKEQS